MARSGVAEAPLKPTWSGVSPRSIAAVLEDLLLPAMREIDVAEASAVERDARPLSRELSGEDADRQRLLDVARSEGAASRFGACWRAKIASR